MNERFYVSCVHGYSAAAGGGSQRKPSELWYVFDSAPPRQSRQIGFGEQARRDAEKLAAQLNRRYGW